MSEKKPVLAVDIGGTGVKVGLVTYQGEVLKKSDFPTPRQDYTTLPTLLKEHIKANYQDSFEGIAISATGIVDTVKKTLGGGSPMYEAFGKDLVKDLEATYQVVVTAENDGNASALAELWIGAGAGLKNIVTVVLGTSVGGAIVSEGKILHGSHNLGGEFGYFLVAGETPEEKPWEIWSITDSTKGLIQKVAKAKEMDYKDLTGYQVVEWYEAKDSIVVPLVEHFVEILAVQCYNIQYAIDPDKILIGGGISTANFLIPKLREKIQYVGSLIPSTVMLPEVDRCQFGNESNLIGAVYYWLQAQNKI